MPRRAARVPPLNNSAAVGRSSAPPGVSRRLRGSPVRPLRRDRDGQGPSLTGLTCALQLAGSFTADNSCSAAPLTAIFCCWSKLEGSANPAPAWAPCPPENFAARTVWIVCSWVGRGSHLVTLIAVSTGPLYRSSFSGATARAGVWNPGGNFLLFVSACCLLSFLHPTSPHSLTHSATHLRASLIVHITLLG